MNPAELPLDVRLMNFTTRMLVGMFFAGAALVAAHWALQRPVWSIRTVEVTGELDHVNPADIRNLALPRLQGNWFTVSLAQAQQAFGMVPWVRSAVVQRVWPLSLVVTLRAQRPLAVWTDAASGTQALLNTEGQIFDGNLGEVQDQPLPRLLGPTGTAQRVAAMYGHLAPLLAPGRIELLGLSAEGNWTVQLAGGPRLDLGSDSDAVAFDARLRRYLALAAGVQQKYGHAIASADLRYANGFAVRLVGADDNTEKAARGAQ